MNDADLIRLLEKAVVFSKEPRFNKLAKAPIKLLRAKILEALSVLLKKPIKTKTRTFWNETMSVVIPEVVSISLQRYGFYEEGVSKMVLTYLRPGMVFLDIGAHFGYFTLLGSFLVGKEGQVHSFEPSPSSYSVLAANASGKQNIVVNNCAVFSKSGVLSLYDYGIRYSAFNSIYGARLPRDVLSKLTVSKFEVESLSIDEYVEKNDIAPDFIKIDAENAEFDILVGMDKAIEAFHPIISIEVGDIGTRYISGSKELISFIRNKGYKAHEFREGTIVPHTDIGRERYSYGNLFFLWGQ